MELGAGSSGTRSASMSCQLNQSCIRRLWRAAKAGALMPSSYIVREFLRYCEASPVGSPSFNSKRVMVGCVGVVERKSKCRSRRKFGRSRLGVWICCLDMPPLCKLFKAKGAVFWPRSVPLMHCMQRSSWRPNFTSGKDIRMIQNPAAIYTRIHEEGKAKSS